MSWDQEMTTTSHLEWSSRTIDTTGSGMRINRKLWFAAAATAAAAAATAAAAAATAAAAAATAAAAGTTMNILTL